ncbi:flagellar hook protein FlgE [Azoarcus sp. L1K30]|uniref:flagellar hook protein FlgE n=1 Tax=Azoarcus sp. L1K30 TaxID=2820277 RepID=UPI001B815461|nr:flagellar hook protein FlgE [Azoarcus sp. L1K30]MBR0565945.1 flagellar hook protein FlgE [Azoarcus sp. L1K30]
MAFQQGLSGLNASSKALDVISNNIANSSTVGFKSSRTIFADAYASAITGGSSVQRTGIGTKVAAVAQSFSQGGLTATSNPLDVAISGNGFFRLVRPDGTTAYSRNGQFDVDKNGHIINASGDSLTGFAADSTSTGGATVFEGVPSVLIIDTSNVNPNETTQASIGLNLDSNSKNPLNQTPLGSDITNFLNATSIPVDSYNYTTSMTVYDSLGNGSLMNMYFVRDADVGGVSPNTWSVYGRLSNDIVPDTTDPALSTGKPLENLGTITFTSFGVPDTSVANNGLFTVTRTAAELATGADDLTFSLNLSQTTQWNMGSGVTTSPRQDGFTTGSLTGVTVTDTGVLQGSYSNGQIKDLAMIALANFSSPQGLTSLGDNLWAESYDSGQPTVGAPGTGVLGSLSAGQVEESNVDLTQELVQLIVQQRNYQANAQSIQAQDQILQTLVNLR